MFSLFLCYTESRVYLKTVMNNDNRLYVYPLCYPTITRLCAVLQFVAVSLINVMVFQSAVLVLVETNISKLKL